MSWQLAALANGIISLAYFLIALALFRALVRSGQLGRNRLALATTLIFASCSAGHGYHVVHLMLPTLGVGVHVGESMRQAYDWHLVAVDATTAFVGVWYWSLRRHYGRLFQGAALFRDMKERQLQALEINDNVVQGLAVAKYALDAGDDARARETLDATLAKARTLVGELLGEQGSDTRLGAGDLRRARPAHAGSEPS